MPDQRVFHAPQLDMGRLVQALADWYRAEKFDVQVLDLPQGGVVIQARREEAWRTLLGVPPPSTWCCAARARTRWWRSGPGSGWTRRWPLLFTAAYGAWQ